ncbi:3-deoxy-7-phosphoheptulonate synthase [Psychrobium sp. 1_MG-2023]|uniref:3-deoxy-7-phosphoheptulonate synthase n=1 Tax=Psychrobium sp. 1_MG-2023 TaxID=3062624 RepID=UPI000C31F1D1|nr:3-deoxy-7-phosphoheptulonate synthase [Psychrobium sp. 1_MG-2023]MDP2562070.1 3-deoxy-7-phosphoheptulonate synthase [Psychrobium sp. 1_MG-2023]PKF58554.1 3-deoxy-7-phosphoheptulonate synthase [Alteromonadales bacterium alter-6D02]
MNSGKIDNKHISSEKVLITPAQLKELMPLNEGAQSYISQARETIANIIHGKDKRLLVVTGPCSIHDIESAKEYALKLKKLHEELKDDMYLVMRIYFEKPRTTVGWKGLLNDPDMDGSFEVEKGLKQGRELLLWLAELELPVATEALDPISPQYLSELFSWAAIGARTTESQTHREMASGLSMPVGFKNGTDGKLNVAINALESAAHSHRFMGINPQGQVALMQTQGNPDGHIILRGGKSPNYQSDLITEIESQIQGEGLVPKLVVDCSHGNSNKDHRRQPLVADDIFDQINQGNSSIMGIMLESHLEEGNQSSSLPKEQLRYGVSVTDACINWADTEQLLIHGAEKVRSALKKRTIST